MATRTRYRHLRRRVHSRYQNTGHQPVVTEDRTIGPSWVDSVVTGPNVRGYALKIARGEDATTSLIGTRTSWPQRRQAYYQVREFDYNGKQTSTAEGFGLPIWPADPGHTALPSTKASVLATQSFAKDYNKKSQAWQGGVFLGELRQSIALVRNPVKRLYNSSHDLAANMRHLRARFYRRRGELDYSRVDREYGKALADLWLTWSFGARPLIRDCDDGAKALAEVLNRRTYDLIRIRGEGQDDDAFGEERVGFVVPFIGIANNAYTWHKRRGESNVVIRGAYRASTVPGARAPGTLGVGFLDVIPTAWELVPWSFLVDYFTNVGDCLDALKLRWISWAWLNRTVRNRRTYTQSDFFTGSDTPYTKYTVSGGRMTRTKTYVDRQKTAPSVFINRPLVEIPGMGSSKWLNVSALATSFLQSKPVRR